MQVVMQRTIIVVPDAKTGQPAGSNKTAANQIAAQMEQLANPDNPAPGGAMTFDYLPLSATGQAPATHWACDAPLVSSVVAALPGQSAVLAPDGQAWNLDTGEELLPGASGWTAGTARSSFWDCIGSIGLQLIKSPTALG